MSDSHHLCPLTRCSVLAAGGGALGLALLPVGVHSLTAGNEPVRLTAGPGELSLKPIGPEVSGARSYNVRIPGPVLRYRQGERLRVPLHNALDQPTTIHWHGIRLPNAMDGVPHVTQPPVAPGDTFEYDFVLPDAGTYWYHPHLNGTEQLGRGLAGALIVDEPEPYPVDRDLLWRRCSLWNAAGPVGWCIATTPPGIIRSICTVTTSACSVATAIRNATGRCTTRC